MIKVYDLVSCITIFQMKYQAHLLQHSLVGQTRYTNYAYTTNGYVIRKEFLRYMKAEAY